MTDVTQELPAIGETGAPFDPRHAIRSILYSLAINGLCPYLLYRLLQPHYAAGSVMPLLFASLFPLAGLAFGLIRTRTVDFIAIFALFEISWNVTTALLASSLGWAMILRSSEGFSVAAFFLVFTLVGHPPIFYIARQFAAGSDPERQRRFAAVNATDKGRTFVLASLVWVAGITAQTLLNLTLALNLTPANYLLAAQVTNITINIAMVVWTIRFARTRLDRYRTPASAKGPDEQK
jgi:hypothetical protein